MSILAAVPNHLQLIPATVLNGHHQSFLCHQLFEEDSVDGEVSPPILLILNLTQLKSRGIRLW